VGGAVGGWRADGGWRAPSVAGESAGAIGLVGVVFVQDRRARCGLRHHPHTVHDAARQVAARERRRHRQARQPRRTIVEAPRRRVASHDLDAPSFRLDEHENAELGQRAEGRVTPQRVRANVAVDQTNLDEELQPGFFARCRDGVPDLVALA
jgi:hypothetical protein